MSPKEVAQHAALMAAQELETVLLPKDDSHTEQLISILNFIKFEKAKREHPEQFKSRTLWRSLARKGLEMIQQGVDLDKPACEEIEVAQIRAEGRGNAKALEELKAENVALRQRLLDLEAGRASHFYASAEAVADDEDDCKIPELGNEARHCRQMVEDCRELDCRERLNTSSYVNVHLEPEEKDVLLLGATVNLADQTVYPESFRLHNKVLNMVANLWHCPKPADFDQHGTYPGAGTVGSTEACLLAGLGLKFRWRKWYAAKHCMTDKEVRAVYPNLVISTTFQAAWEKLFRYMDIEPKFVAPSKDTFALTPGDVAEVVDERTIGVVCILGNHYGGHYDPVWEIDEMLGHLNAERGYQVGIHVDAASGGFVAPFQQGLPPWDFRLPRVLSISASGHKFGESCCGTGWVVWRQRQDLSEHVACSVSYLGGHADSYTLNFSRPASGVYVQFYKFLRLGLAGYQAMTDNRMANAKYLRDVLRKMTVNGKPRFTMLCAGDTHCLPVVAACFNPELELPYDCNDLQDVMLQTYWYVSGYSMSFHDPSDERVKPLVCDMPTSETMFRVVVKANVTRAMMTHLVQSMRKGLESMDALGAGFRSIREAKKATEMRHGPC